MGVDMNRKIFILSLFFVFMASMVMADQEGATKIRVLPAPPNLISSVQFIEPSGNNILDAEEEGKLILTIENKGPGDAFDVEASLKPNKKIKDLLFDTRTPIGSISAGKTVKKEIPIKAGENIPTDTVSFIVELTEANGFEPPPIKVTFKTKEFIPPQLILADIGINDQNKNSRVEPMEIVEVTARIQNIGHGDAKNVTVDIIPGQNVFMAGDSKTHYELGYLTPGKYKDITFMFYTNNRIKNNENIPITVQIKEARNRYNTSKPLNLVMNAPQRSTQEVFVKGEDTTVKPDIKIAGGLSIDVDMQIPEGHKAGRYDIAVIIGNKHYSQSGAPDIDYADRDARIMKEYLIFQLLC